MAKGQSSSSSGSSRNGPPVVLRIYSGDRSPEIHTANSGYSRGFSTKPLKKADRQHDKKVSASEVQLPTIRGEEYEPPAPQLVLKGALQGERTLSSSIEGSSTSKKKRRAAEEKHNAEVGGTEFLIHPALLRFYNRKLEDAYRKKQEKESRANIFIVFFIIGVVAAVSAVVSAITLGDGKWYEYVGWALALVAGFLSICFALSLPFVLPLFSPLRNWSDVVFCSAILAVVTVMVFFIWAVEGMKNDDLVIMDILFWSCFSWFGAPLWKAWIIPSMSLIVFGAASFDMFTGLSPPLGSFMFVGGKFLFLFLSGLFGAYKNELEDRRDTFTSTALLDSICLVQHSTTCYRDVLGMMGYDLSNENSARESTESDSIPNSTEEDDMQILPNSPGRDVENKEYEDATVVFVTFDFAVDDLISVKKLVQYFEEANALGMKLGLRVLSASSTRSIVAVASDRSSGEIFARCFVRKEGAVVRIGSGPLVITCVRQLKAKCATAMVSGEGAVAAKVMSSENVEQVVVEGETLEGNETVAKGKLERDISEVDVSWSSRHGTLPSMRALLLIFTRLCSVSLAVNANNGVDYKFYGWLMRFSRRDAEERYIRRSARFFSRALAPRGVFLILISVFYIWLVFAAMHEEGVDRCLEATSCYLPVAAVVFVLVPLFVLLLSLSSCHVAFFFVYMRAVSLVIILSSLTMIAIFDNVHAKMIWVRSLPVWTGFCIFVLEVPLYFGWLTVSLSLVASLGFSFGLGEACNGTFSAMSTIGLHLLFAILGFRKNLALRRRFMLNECLEEELLRQQSEKEAVKDEMCCRLPKGVDRRIAKGVKKVLESRLINGRVKGSEEQSVDDDDDDDGGGGDRGDDESKTKNEFAGIVCSVELKQQNMPKSVAQSSSYIQQSTTRVARLSRKHGLLFIQSLQGRFILSIRENSHEDYVNRALMFAADIVDEMSSPSCVCKVGLADGTIVECIPFQHSAAGSLYVYAGSAVSQALACTAAISGEEGGVNIASSLAQKLREQNLQVESGSSSLSSLSALNIPPPPRKDRVKSSKMSQYSIDPLLADEDSAMTATTIGESVNAQVQDALVATPLFSFPPSISLYVEGCVVQRAVTDEASGMNATGAKRRGIFRFLTRA